MIGDDDGDCSKPPPFVMIRLFIESFKIVDDVADNDVVDGNDDVETVAVGDVFVDCIIDDDDDDDDVVDPSPPPPPPPPFITDVDDGDDDEAVVDDFRFDLVNEFFSCKKQQNGNNN